MQFPVEGIRACDALYERHRVLAHSADPDDRRLLTRMISEQIAWALGPRWGVKKRAGLGDEYQSKDTIAYREDDDTTSGWDWQNGNSRQRLVKAGADPDASHMPDSEATFMPVTPTNHLGWTRAGEPPAPPTETPPTETPVPPAPPPAPDSEAVLRSINDRLGAIEAGTQTLVDRPDMVNIPSDARVFGQGITITPRKPK